jgi:CHAD domain-containing protein
MKSSSSYIMPRLTHRHDLLRARLQRFTRAIPGVDKGSIHAVHQARVASRRLREVLPVLQLEPDLTQKLGRRLRRVTQRLGRLRELDVLLGLVQDLQDARAYAPEALEALSQAVRHERDRHRGKSHGKSAAAELERVARKLTKVSRHLAAADSSAAANRSWRWALEARVARRAAEVDRAMTAAGALYLSERLHDVRIAVKKLRYAQELMVEAGDESGRDVLAVLKRTQRLLGRMHDLDVLIASARQLQASLASRRPSRGEDVDLRTALDAVIIGLDRSCRRLHARYVRDRRTLSAICHRFIARSSSHARTASLRRAV